MYEGYWECSSKYCSNTTLHLNCKDWKIKMLFHFRIPAGLLRSLLYHAQAVFHEKLLFTHFLSQHSVGTSVQRESSVRDTSTNLTIKDQLCKRLYWCLYLMIFFLYFIFKQQFQALHKKIWTTTACALLNITYQIQPMTTYPITRF